MVGAAERNSNGFGLLTGAGGAQPVLSLPKHAPETSPARRLPVILSLVALAKWEVAATAERSGSVYPEESKGTIVSCSRATNSRKYTLQITSPRYIPHVANLKWAKIGAALMLLWALADNPYAYYQILRWVVCGVNGYAAYLAFEEKRKWWTWAFGIAAILFNPIAPFHFKRETWALLDFVVAVFLFVSLYAYKPQPYSAVSVHQTTGNLDIEAPDRHDEA